MDAISNGDFVRLSNTVPATAVGRLVAVNLAGESVLVVTAASSGAPMFISLRHDSTQFSDIPGIRSDIGFCYEPVTTHFVVCMMPESVDFSRVRRAGDILLGEDGSRVLVIRFQSGQLGFMDLSTFEVTDELAYQTDHVVVHEWKIEQDNRLAPEHPPHVLFSRTLERQAIA